MSENSFPAAYLINNLMELYRKLKELEEIKWLEELERARLIPTEEGQGGGGEDGEKGEDQRWVKANHDALKSENPDWRAKVNVDENFNNMDTNWEGEKLYH